MKANGGWTTSRHYAVPTTDLPVHALKETVLPWFRSLLRSERGFIDDGMTFFSGGGGVAFVYPTRSRSLLASERDFADGRMDVLFSGEKYSVPVYPAGFSSLLGVREEFSRR